MLGYSPLNIALTFSVASSLYWILQSDQSAVVIAFISIRLGKISLLRSKLSVKTVELLYQRQQLSNTSKTALLKGLME
jgi:hypothetical protein